MKRRLLGAGIRRGIREAVAASSSAYLTPAYDDPAWTFTRASEAAAVDPRDGWAFYDTGTPWPGVNVVRVLPDGAVLLEEARTNAFEHSADLTSPPLTHLNSPTVTADDGTAPDGTGADLVAFAAGGALGQVRDPMNDGIFTNGADSVLSAYFEDPDGENIEFLFRDKALVADFTGAQAMPTSWGRLYADVANGSGTADPLLVLYENTDGADFHCWGVQCEEGAFATSPIRTAGATVTRARDSLEIASGDIGADLFTTGFTVDVWPLWDSTTPTLAMVLTNTGGTRFVRFFNGNQIQVFGDAGSVTAPVVAFSAGDKVTIRVEWGVEVSVAVNDGVPVTASLAAVGDWSDFTGTARVGFFSGSAQQISAAVGRFGGL